MVKKALLFFVVFGFAQVQALSLRSLNIEELIVRADRIFLGRVVQTSSEKEVGKPPAMITRFQVLESYKGNLGSEVTIRQLARKGAKGQLALMMGLPRFVEGETVVIFLTGESSLGFSSPLGMQQGLFRVVGKGTDPSRMMLMNGFQNQKLFAHVTHGPTQALLTRMQADKASSKDSSLALKDLKDLIRVRMEVKP